MIRPLSLLLGLTIPTAIAPAAEPVFKDLYFAAEIPIGDFSYDLTVDGGSPQSGDDSFDSQFAAEIGWRQSFTPAGWQHGPVVGLAVTANYATYDFDSSLIGYGGRLTPGWAWSLNDSWTLLGKAIVEYGIAEWDFPENEAFNGIQADGDFLGYGATVGAHFAWGDHWQFDSALGYLSRSYDLDGERTNIEVTSNAFLIQFGLSYRFSAAPSRLD